MKRPRCIVVQAEPGQDPKFTHTWRLTHPCGKTSTSHAAEPPLARSCAVPPDECPMVAARPRRPEFEW